MSDYAAGVLARQAGQPWQDNPFLGQPAQARRRADWATGWLDRDLEIRSAGLPRSGRGVRWAGRPSQY